MQNQPTPNWSEMAKTKNKSVTDEDKKLQEVVESCTKQICLTVIKSENIKPHYPLISIVNSVVATFCMNLAIHDDEEWTLEMFQEFTNTMKDKVVRTINDTCDHGIEKMYNNYKDIKK